MGFGSVDVEDSYVNVGCWAAGCFCYIVRWLRERRRGGVGLLVPVGRTTPRPLKRTTTLEM